MGRYKKKEKCNICGMKCFPTWENPTICMECALTFFKASNKCPNCVDGTVSYSSVDNNAETEDKMENEKIKQVKIENAKVVLKMVQNNIVSIKEMLKTAEDEENKIRHQIVDLEAN